MNFTRRPREPFVAGIALLGLAACSALTIEVDVYKGPLANEKDVQVQQLSVMAIAAKPLLIQLRDKLEVQGILKERGHFTYSPKQLRSEPWYQDAWFMEPEPVSVCQFLFEEDSEEFFKCRRAALLGKRIGVGDASYPFFKDTWARRVHAILGLYEDLGDDVYGSIVRNALASYQRFEEDRDQLVSGGRSARTWARIRPAASTNDQGSRALFSAFDAFLRPQQSARSAEACLAALPGVEEDSFAILGLGELDSARDLGANASFGALERPEVVQLAADVLFSGDEERLAFTEAVTSLAASFRRSRAELDFVFVSALAYLRDAGRDESPMAAERRELSATVVSELINTYYLSAAIEDVVALESPATEAVVEHLGGELRTVAAAYEQKDRAQISQARAAFGRQVELVFAGPARHELADALLDVHLRFADSYVAGSASRYPKFVDDPSVETAQARRRYGVVVGPSTALDAGAAASDQAPGRDAKELPSSATQGMSPADLSEQFERSDLEALANGADRAGLTRLQGLGTGRLPQGLDTLTTEYLEAVSNDSPAVERVRRKLELALVRFAEKLRILGSFDQLSSSGAEIEEYTETLAAISNSILTTANALEGDQRYDERQTELALIESEAAKQSGPGGSLHLGQPSKTAKDVIDQSIARLRHQLARELKAGESAQAEHTRAALDQLLEGRGGMGQIRSAAQYLRSSYLTDSSQTESNSVRKEGRRSTKQTTERSIDQQFWQRINTVELEGVGSTEYVVVKDDVGNWYVKGFSADTTDLIRTAKGLALFAVSGGVSPVAMARAEALLSDDPGEALEAEKDGDYAQSVLVLLEAENERAEQELASLWSELADDCQALSSDLVERWKSGALRDRKLAAAQAVLLEHAKELEGLLGEERTQEALEASLGRIRTTGAQILAGLENAHVTTLLDDYEGFREAGVKLDAAVAANAGVVQATEELARAAAVHDFDESWQTVDPAILDAGGKYYSAGPTPISWNASDWATLREEAQQLFDGLLGKYKKLRSAQLEERLARLDALSLGRPGS